MKERLIKGATLFNPRIYHQSYLNACTLICESPHEQHHCIDLEFDPSIEAFTTQPASFKYEYRGKMRRVTFDVMSRDTSGVITQYELKDAKYARCPALLEKMAFLTELFKTHQNMVIKFITSDETYADPSHTTRRILYKFMPLNVPINIKEMAIRSLYKSEITIGALEKKFVQKNVDRTFAWAFLAQQYSSITFVGEPEISPSTLISWSQSL
jgi:uncharacterized protein YdhG (YjbR/CyaY superfamily)